MERKSALVAVKEVITEVCGCEPREETQRIKQDLGIDSLALVAVVVALEEKFGIAFDDGDLDPARLVEVGDLAELVCKSL